MGELAPAASARRLIGEYRTIPWEENPRPARNTVRRIWRDLVETYGKEEARGLVYAFLMAEHPHTADSMLWQLTELAETELEEVPDAEG